MKKVKLSDVCSIIVPMRDKPKEFVSNNNAIPWCRIEDIEGKFLNGSKSHKYVSRECISKMNLRVFPIGTVLCAVTGASIGTYAITTKELITNQTFAGLVCGEQLYNEYLYYFIKLYTNVFINNSVGCAQAYITRETLENLMIPLLPYEKQVQLVEILKFLDDKINNNNKINTELESMAKTIYDYWFLQFEFPNEEGKPYKSSGGKMVWNEELKREIPEGWEVKRISDILEKIPKTIKYKSNEYNNGTIYPIVDQSSNYICGYTDNKTSLLNLEDCIIFGDHTKYVKYVNFPFARGADGTQVINSSDCRLPNYLLYRQILNMDLVSQGYSRYFKFLKEKNVFLPKLNISKKYMAIMYDILSKSRQIIKENQELSSIRDFLLPLLMNGQVGFKEEMKLAEVEI